MFRWLIFAVPIFAALATPGVARAACNPPVIWTNVYDGPGVNTDVLNAAAFDAAGNLMVGITESFASTSQ